MAYKKNTAVTGFVIGSFLQTVDGAEVATGTPTCTRIIDGTAGSCANAASYNATLAGWEIDLDAADMNGDQLGFVFKLASCVPIWVNIHTVTGVPDANGKMASTLQSTDVTGYVQTNCIQIKTVDADTALVNNVGPTVFLDFADGVETNITPRMLFRATGALVAGLLSGAGTGSEAVKGIGQASGGTTRLTFSGDAAGNRDGVVLNLS